MIGKLLERFDKALGRGEEVVSILLLAVLVAVLNLQVVSRYVFASPLIWPEEVSRVALIWLSFIAMAAVTRRGTHIAVDMAINYLPPLVRRVLETFIDLLIAACFIFVALLAYPLTQAIAQMSLMATNWSTAVLVWPLVVGSMLAAFHSIMRIFFRFTTPQQLSDMSGDRIRS